MNDWLRTAKQMFWLGLVMQFLGSKMFTELINGLLDADIPPDPTGGVFILAVAAVAALIAIADQKKG